MTWPKNPIIYEINTWAWLHALSEQYAEPITLANVPAAELDRLASYHFDAIWLMGVWQRSKASAEIARQHPGLQAAYSQALPDFTPDDVVGSPYAVYHYIVDAHLGGPEGLAVIRAELAARGMKLLLDFVSNHLAIDHPGTIEDPRHFMPGTPEDLANAPDAYFAVEVDGEQRIYAHGRDPYFPPWTDTVQINTANIGTRREIVEALRRIANQCDGVRCDMAMLNINEVFRRTWGEHGHPDITDEFWEFVIPRVRRAHPDFLFVAEAYWDLGWVLQQQGFDYTYDKRLYDRLRMGDVGTVRAHLNADMTYQERLVRFIENHDEARAPLVFGLARARAAALMICTLPGACLLYEGQFEGAHINLPVQLGRRPVEPVRGDLPAFYARLLTEASQPVYKDGTWAMLDVSAAGRGNNGYKTLIAYAWTHAETRRVVVINLAPEVSQARVHLPWGNLAGRSWQFCDVLGDARYQHKGDDLDTQGMYVALPPHGYHLFRVEER